MSRPKKYPYTRSQWSVIEDSIYTGSKKIATIKTKVNVFSGEVFKEVENV